MLNSPVFKHVVESNNAYLQINLADSGLGGRCEIPLRFTERTVLTDSDSESLTKFKSAITNVVFHQFIKDIKTCSAGYIIISPPRTAINVNKNQIVISNALFKISIGTTQNAIDSLADVIQEHIRFCELIEKNQNVGVFQSVTQSATTIIT